jgi:hypothetical protein
VSLLIYFGFEYCDDVNGLDFGVCVMRLVENGCSSLVNLSAEYPLVFIDLVELGVMFL